MPDGFEEPAGIIDRPRLARAALIRLTAFRYLDRAYRVAADYLILDGACKCGTEYVTCVFPATRGERFLAAFTNRAAASFIFRARNIFSLRAALTDNGKLI
jgi:hypothetical protein